MRVLLLVLLVLFVLAPLYARGDETPAAAVAADGSAAASEGGAAEAAEPAAAAAAAEEPKKKTKKIELTITEPQYCATCHAVVEEFFRFSLQNMHRNQMNLTLPHEELIDKYCKATDPFMSVFHPFFQHGCLKIMQDHFAAVLDPFLGSHYTAEFAYLNKVYLHKLAVCDQIGACKSSPDMLQREHQKEFTECENCERVAWVTEKMVRRERPGVLKAERVKNYVHAVCRELGMHLRYPLDAEEFCNDLFEEYGDDAEAAYLEYFTSDAYKRSNSGEHPALLLHHSQGRPNAMLREKVCIELTGVCAASSEDKAKHKAYTKVRHEQARQRAFKNPYRKGAASGQRSRDDDDEL